MNFPLTNRFPVCAIPTMSPAAEVDAACRSAAKAARISKDVAAKRRSIYGTQLETLGLALPALRKIHKAGFSFTRESPEPEAVLASFAEVWHESPLFESKIQPLLYYEALATHKNPARRPDVALHFPELAAWVGDPRNGCDNWEHSDRFSKIFADFHERAPQIVYPVLKDWNASPNPWLRRQSVVSLLCYAFLRKRSPAKSKIFPLLRRLLDDEKIYVQKGLGWTLRETGHVYPEDTLAFLEHHLSSISATAFRAAVEKLDAKTRDRLKRSRQRRS